MRDGGPRGFVALAVLFFAFHPSSIAAATVELQLRQKDGQALAEAVLAVYALDERQLAAPAKASMDQLDRRFSPQVLPVQKGAAVSFPNSDSVSHHVYSFSPAKRFEIFLAKGEAPQTVDFALPGIVTLGCNLHDWMLGYVAVLDTPYFAVTDEAGRARAGGLPAGRYRLEVWHPRLADPQLRIERLVNLEASSAEAWDLRLDKALLPARDQKPGFAQY